MRKMNKDDVAHVVQILRRWKRGPMFWDHLRQRISVEIMDGEEAWSRQALQANELINQEWLATRKRLTDRRVRSTPFGPDGVIYDEAGNDSLEVQRLRKQLEKLQTQYDNLLLRHRQLVHNASMLPGGTRLFLDPLPDNTPVQKVGAGSKRTRRK